MTTTELLMRLEIAPLKIGLFTLSLEYRKCGKCSRCPTRPHGPYLYLRDHTGRRRYIGSANRLTDREIHAALRGAGFALPD